MQMQCIFGTTFDSSNGLQQWAYS